MVNLELYRVFYAVARCGSLTKAAEELFISQPAVSQAVKQLENQLGGKLFIRTHRGMELSEPGGRQMFEAVEQALRILDGAEARYAELKNTATGVLRICASDTVATHFLIDYIKLYHEMYPDVKIVIQNCTSAETIENIRGKKGDIGFVNLPVDDRDVNLSNKVMQLHDIFVASEAFSELTAGPVPLARLHDYPLLMLELSTATRQAIVSYAHALGIHLHPEIELASLELMTELAKKGIGIACIPREFVRHELDAGALKEVVTDPALPVRGIGLVLPKDEAPSFAVREFLNLLNKAPESAR